MRKFSRAEHRWMPADLCITLSTVDHPDARMLLLQLYAEQCGMYGFADAPELDVNRHAWPNGAFMIARVPSVGPVGCGGFRMHPQRPYVAEIKRMYVVPTWRGNGVGRRILTDLEQLAATYGAADLLLETGCDNDLALRLYRSAGYHSIAAYVPGRDSTVNRAFAKKLDAKPGTLPQPA